MQIEQGSPVVIWAHFLKQDGQEATISGTPIVTIRHWQVNTSSLDTDVNGENMTQVSGSLYYYVWNYTTIVKSNYVATVATTYSTGENVKGTQTFTINQLKIIGAGGGVWTQEEKEKIIKVVNDIIKTLKNIPKNDLRAEVDNIENKLSSILNNTSELKGQEDYITRIKTIEEKLKDIKQEIDLQSGILVGIADIKTLESIKKGG